MPRAGNGFFDWGTNYNFGLPPRGAGVILPGHGAGNALSGMIGLGGALYLPGVLGAGMRKKKRKAPARPKRRAGKRRGGAALPPRLP